MLKSKFSLSSLRPILSVRRRLTTSTYIDAEKVTTILPLPEEITNFKHNRRISPAYRTTTLRSTNEFKTPSTYTRNYSNKQPTHQLIHRRTYVRPEKRRSTTINLDSIDLDATVEATTFRNTNAPFRRRYTFTTSTNPPNINILTTFPVPTINIDQEAGSSIQASKFFNNKLVRNFNGNENIDESITEIPSGSDSNTILTTPQYTKHNSSLFDVTENENRASPNLNLNKTISHKNFNTPTTTNPPKMLKIVRKRPQKTYESNSNYHFAQRTYRPVIDYDYYDDEDVRVVSKSNSLVKVILHGHGIIECLDQGNFPHPLSCRKFISCAKMGKDTEGAIGWEYTCPKGLSYDPVGGICNWASGLGCKE